MPLVIAIDGPSASGKGTLARKLAEYKGYAYLDTGLLYRAVGIAVVKSGHDPQNAQKAEEAAQSLDPTKTPSAAEEADLRSDTASVAASKVAEIPAVREALLKFQRDFCSNPPLGKPGAVLDGRDIGTVIAPDAPVKIFVTASAESRAMRRFKELQAKDPTTDYAAVLKDMKDRDARDAQRAVAPTKPADDAVVLDTTELNAEQAFTEAVKIVEEKLRTHSLHT